MCIIEELGWQMHSPKPCPRHQTSVFWSLEIKNDTNIKSRKTEKDIVTGMSQKSREPW